MVRILDPQPGHSILDPASGSGALLLASLEYAGDKDGSRHLVTSGIDRMLQAVALGTMKMMARGFPADGLQTGDAFVVSSREGESRGGF